ncbi:hypothetical protein EVAR_18034_1 [Eumeta japonica]|uniref:Uncharacterized protein n=1 Tax=Eumeta variegata TaxID=151549 RepID=A0A4C1XUY5_EUMVA|nr:hypothetical protein EVAR_18034_1 [Eumeta japonica]
MYHSVVRCRPTLLPCTTHPRPVKDATGSPDFPRRTSLPVMSSQLSWPMSSSGLASEAPPGGTHSGGDGWRSRPPCHWHNFQQRFDSPVPIFVTVSLTADSFGCAARAGRASLPVLGWSSVWWPRLHFAQPFARQYARGRHAASLCSDAHFGHFAVTSVCVFTLKASRRRGALGYPPGALALN